MEVSRYYESIILILSVWVSLLNEIDSVFNFNKLLCSSLTYIFILYHIGRRKEDLTYTNNVILMLHVLKILDTKETLFVKSK